MLFSQLLYMLLRISIIRVFFFFLRATEIDKSVLGPGLPLVFLKGQGEDLNILGGQVQRQAWYGISFRTRLW